MRNEAINRLARADKDKVDLAGGDSMAGSLIKKGLRSIFKRDDNPFFNKEKRANFEALRKAGYNAQQAKRLVETNPRYMDDEVDYQDVKPKKTKTAKQKVAPSRKKPHKINKRTDLTKLKRMHK